MQKSILELHKTEDGRYQSYIKNNHGRKVYLLISIVGDNCEICSCFYIDRAKRPEPKLLETRRFPYAKLLSVIARELDKTYDFCKFVDAPSISTEGFISKVLHGEKYNILIMLKDGNILKTIFKNRFRREIYLEIDMSDELALVKMCKYCDVRGVDVNITPYNLITIRFRYDFDTLLRIVNDELEGGFTDVIITENHTIVLDRPICGSI